MTTIDLNCDLGEGAGLDELLMPLVTSANIACGAHAGDEDTMRTTVELARRHGVAIGAHPGHRDPLRVGRVALPLTPAAAARLVSDQVAVLARLAGPDLVHVKLHGGLYHQVAHDATLAEAVAAAIAADWPRLFLFAPAGSPLVAVARSLGLAVAEEGFVDRAYGDDGRLVPRSSAGGGLIADPHAAAAQAVLIARDGRVRAASGRLIPLRADTLCIHGDGPEPLATARAVRGSLEAAGLTLRSPRSG
jgi:UPF0271 protein